VKRQFLRELKDGEAVSDRFAVKFKKPPTEYRGKPGKWFEFRASDRSGEATVKYWGTEDVGKTMEAYGGFESGDVIELKGTVQEYPPGSGKMQISVDGATGSIRKCSKDEYDIGDFVPASEKDTEAMFKELLAVKKTIKDKDLSELLSAFFGEGDFVELLKTTPAAMHYHQNYIGGLLEHTLNVVRVCEKLSELHEKLDRDLLITGAILHDIGKIRELEVSTSIDITREGMLLGHVIIGKEMVGEKIKELEDFPERLGMKLEHIILSHHGKLEYGSPKLPQFPEALAVYYADEMDAKVSFAIRMKEEARTEDPWIWVKEFGHIYLE